MSLVGYGKNQKVITEDERIEFLCTDGVVVRFDSRVQLPANESGLPNVFIHHYYMKRKDVEALQKSKVLIVRVFNLQSHYDIAVHRRHAADIRKLSDMFLKEISRL